MIAEDLPSPTVLYVLISSVLQLIHGHVSTRTCPTFFNALEIGSDRLWPWLSSLIFGRSLEISPPYNGDAPVVPVVFSRVRTKGLAAIFSSSTPLWLVFSFMRRLPLDLMNLTQGISFASSASRLRKTTHVILDVGKWFFLRKLGRCG